MRLWKQVDERSDRRRGSFCCLSLLFAVLIFEQLLQTREEAHGFVLKVQLEAQSMCYTYFINRFIWNIFCLIFEIDLLHSSK